MVLQDPLQLFYILKTSKHSYIIAKLQYKMKYKILSTLILWSIVDISLIEFVVHSGLSTLRLQDLHYSQSVI